MFRLSGRPALFLSKSDRGRVDVGMNRKRYDVFIVMGYIHIYIYIYIYIYKPLAEADVKPAYTQRNTTQLVMPPHN